METNLSKILSRCGSLLLQGPGCFGLACGREKGLPGFLRVTANEFHRSVHNHLRRLGGAVSERPGINVLPRRPIVRRERVGPPLVVPVIDMLLQRDQLNVPGKRYIGQAGQQSIRRWAAGATFGGEQFDDYPSANSFRFRSTFVPTYP